MRRMHKTNHTAHGKSLGPSSQRSSFLRRCCAARGSGAHCWASRGPSRAREESENRCARRSSLDCQRTAGRQRRTASRPGQKWPEVLNLIHDLVASTVTLALGVLVRQHGDWALHHNPRRKIIGGTQLDNLHLSLLLLLNQPKPHKVRLVRASVARESS